MNASRSSIVNAIVIAGLIAGTIDIGAASLIYRIDPLVILRVVASGLLGRDAMHGGLPVSALGLILQWIMSALIAAIYVLVLRNVRTLRLNWIPAGVIYGVLVFVVMNYIVVPLSAASANHHFPHFTPEKLIENGLAMILFGLIVSFTARNIVGEHARR